MAKFNFKLRDPNGNSETAVFLITHLKGERLVYPTHLSIHPDFWHFIWVGTGDKRRKKYTQGAVRTMKFPNHPQFNLKLDDIKSRAEKKYLELSTALKQEPSKSQLKEVLDIEFERTGAETNEKHTLFSYIKKFIEQAEYRTNPKTGKPLAKGTILAAKRSFDLLKEFKDQHKKALDFDSIDLDFYYDYKAFLTKKGFAINTIGGRISKLKWFLNGATDEGVNTKLSFKSKKFAVNQARVESIYLNEKELEDLRKLSLSKNEKLERVRDLFLVGCWTGLRFSDFSSLSKDNISDDFIEITTQKTNETVVIPIYPVVKEIMNRYEGKTPNSLPRSLSNVKMNLYLKELGQKVESLKEKITVKTHVKGMDILKDYFKYELLTTHTARRSFATNLYLDGFPSIDIMKITGHRTERAFMLYIKVTPKQSAQSLQLHWKRKEGLKIAQ